MQRCRQAQSLEDVRLPPPRGPLSSWVLDLLRGVRRSPPAVGMVDPFDEDLQLALYCAYEPHFSDLPGVVDDVEWDLDLLAVRRQLERTFEVGLRGVVPPWRPAGPVDETLPALIAADECPSVSSYLEASGSLDQMRDYVVHRSAYQLKEADGHTLGIPRLAGRAKQRLAEIQAGEYGVDGDDRIMHAVLFAQTMRELGLDDRRHAYLDVLPGSALAVSNLISMFGLHRRWRGALLGHLAVFEMTSVVAMGRYSRAMSRMGASAAARRFYDVHVLADAEHEEMALRLVSDFAREEPRFADDALFGAAAALAVERSFAEGLLKGWGAMATAVA